MRLNKVIANQVTRKVLELPEFKSAASISIFLSMPNKEISTRDVVVKALEQDKKVFIPYIHADFPKSKSKVMDMLRLRDRKDLDALEPDAWGIPSLPPDGVEGRENALGGRGVRGPTSDTAECCLDLIFMPALAFDVEANRLGHGKGFYDKYISRLPDRPRLGLSRSSCVVHCD